VIADLGQVSFIDAAGLRVLATVWGSRTRSPVLTWDFKQLARIR
jgi:anti-anti-sigma regulatory factor